jgi:hypothetical protein
MLHSKSESGVSNGKNNGFDDGLGNGGLGRSGATTSTTQGRSKHDSGRSNGDSNGLRRVRVGG